MKAAVYHVYGGPEVVKVTTLPDPVPADDEILVKVYASTVNRTDDGFRSANYVVSRLFTGLFRPKYHVLGCEYAGRIIQIGKNVKRWKVGDEIFGFNDRRMGGHAELLVLKENDAIGIKPANITFEEAAALTEGAHYALTDIYAACVIAGQDVLVYGATGAIGTAAVQLLKYFGANVTATSDAARISLVKSLGAEEVIDYNSTDYSTLGHKYDFVFDTVGKSSFSAARQVLKSNGIYISTELGKNGDNVWRGLAGKFQRGKRVLFPLPMIKQEDIDLIGKLAAEGKFKPVLDRSFRLDEIVEAHRYVASGKKTGNVVIRFD